jgi:hypothetical protein
MTQTTYNNEPALGRDGQTADCGFDNRIDSFLAEGVLTFGLLVQAGTDPDRQVKPMAALPAADVDSIIETAVNTAASELIISGADFDSAVYGAGAIVPCQRVTVALSSHADFDLTTGEIHGEGPNGDPIVEQLAIPDGGNVTLTTVNVFRRVDKIVIPAQSGTGGEITAGTTGSDDEIVLSRKDFPGVVKYAPGLEPESSTEDIGDEDPVDVQTRGTVWVTVEEAVAKGDGAWVRVVESSPDVRGQFRGSYATGFARLEGASFLTTQASADGVAILRLP